MAAFVRITGGSPRGRGARDDRRRGEGEGGAAGHRAALAVAARTRRGGRPSPSRRGGPATLPPRSRPHALRHLPCLLHVLTGRRAHHRRNGCRVRRGPRDGRGRVGRRGGGRRAAAALPRCFRGSTPIIAGRRPRAPRPLRWPLPAGRCDTGGAPPKPPQPRPRPPRRSSPCATGTAHPSSPGGLPRTPKPLQWSRPRTAARQRQSAVTPVANTRGGPRENWVLPWERHHGNGGCVWLEDKR